MNQKRKFENKKVFLINNAGQKSLYIGLLVLTFLILFIGKADLAIVNRVSIIISVLSAPAISSISKQTKILLLINVAISFRKSSHGSCQELYNW